MSSEAKREPGQRAYEAMCSYDRGGSYPWADISQWAKDAWAAVEQACAVPAPSATPSKSEGEWTACRHGYMPPDGEKVMFWCRGWLTGATPGLGTYNGDFWEDETQTENYGDAFKLIPSSEVTHWMPLPPPPKAPDAT